MRNEARKAKAGNESRRVKNVKNDVMGFHRDFQSKREASVDQLINEAKINNKARFNLLQYD